MIEQTKAPDMAVGRWLWFWTMVGISLVDVVFIVKSVVDGNGAWLLAVFAFACCGSSAAMTAPWRRAGKDGN